MYTPSREHPLDAATKRRGDIIVTMLVISPSAFLRACVLQDKQTRLLLYSVIANAYATAPIVLPSFRSSRAE